MREVDRCSWPEVSLGVAARRCEVNSSLDGHGGPRVRWDSREGRGRVRAASRDDRRVSSDQGQDHHLFLGADCQLVCPGDPLLSSFLLFLLLLLKEERASPCVRQPLGISQLRTCARRGHPPLNVVTHPKSATQSTTSAASRAVSGTRWQLHQSSVFACVSHPQRPPPSSRDPTPTSSSVRTGALSCPPTQPRGNPGSPTRPHSHSTPGRSTGTPSPARGSSPSWTAPVPVGRGLQAGSRGSPSLKGPRHSSLRRPRHSS